MGSVYRYELKRAFLTPVAYVFAGAFMLLAGLMFFFYNLAYKSGEVISYLSDLTSFLMFLIPVLTMRSFAEEKKNHSDQFLLTAPLSVFSIVMGKFWAAVTIYCLTLLLTGVFVAIIGIYGLIYWGEVLAGYTGFLFLSLCYISSGLWVSSLCENQVSAAIATFGLHFTFSALDWVIPYVKLSWLSRVLESLSLYEHFKDTQNGTITLSSLCYFASITALFLFLTALTLQSRRWRKE